LFQRIEPGIPHLGFGFQPECADPARDRARPCRGAAHPLALIPQVQDPTRAGPRGWICWYCHRNSAPDHPAEEVFRERHVCVVWRDSALAEGELTLERYMNAGHVVMVPPAPIPARWKHGWPTSWALRRVEVTSFSFASCVELVQGTDRIATVHSRLAHKLAPQLPVVLKESPLPLAQMHQMMQWHRYRTNDPGIEWLRRVILESAREMEEDVG
jgi:DNA-binding transcriptional LysR family regulator